MVTLDELLFKKLEDFRFEHRFESKSEAASALIRLGFEQLENRKDPSNPKPREDG
jgi:metal-responsive CopG/Arc/MetJ family transcriptional regulator